MSLCRQTLSKLFAFDMGCTHLLEDGALAVALSAGLSDQPSDEEIRQYSLARQIEAFTKKEFNPDEPVTDSLVEASLRNLTETESDCYMFNSMFEDIRSDAELYSVVNQVAFYSERFFPPLLQVEEEIWGLCRFGPGATFGSGGPKGVHILSKIAGRQTVTQECLPLAARVLRDYFPNWAKRLIEEKVTFSITPGNRLEFVPKDKQKCRQIAVEPSLNLFLQMGVGNWLARRCRTFGIDLRDQTRNRSLAKLGSLSGDWATIDMSDASNRISRNVVKALVPRDWYSMLNRIRSQSGRTPSGEWIDYEMFSSQGNAFTFPLETIIFWSIARSVTDELSVYGDDIVVPTWAFAEVVRRLNMFGFLTNDSKSYSTGFFRESCGGDYIKGFDVRPYYYKADALLDSDVAKVHNSLLKKWGQLPSTQQYLVSLVPEHRRLYGPRMLWSDETNPGVNILEERLSSYFWCDEVFFDVLGKPLMEWAERPVPYKWVSLYPDSARELAFVYAGRNVEDQSKLRRTFKRRISASRETFFF